MQQFYKKMRKASVGLMFVGLFLILLGAGLFWGLNQEAIEYLMADTELYDLLDYEIRDDEYYVSHNNLFLDWYGSDDEGRWYICPVETLSGEDTYMGYYVYNKDVALADEIVDATWEYYDGGAYPELYISGRGYTYRMSYDEREYFTEYLEEMGADDAVLQNLVYETFYLTPFNEYIKIMDHNFWINSIISGIFLVVGVIIVINFLSGGYKRSVKKTMAMKGISEDALERDLGMPGMDKDIDCGSRYAILYGNPSQLLVLDDLIWVHMHTTVTRHRIYGVIPAGSSSTYMVKYYTRDGKSNGMSVSNEERGQHMMRRLQERASHAIYGYSEELDSLYRNRFQEFLQMVDAKRGRVDTGFGGYDSNDTNGSGYKDIFSDDYKL